MEGLWLFLFLLGASPVFGSDAKHPLLPSDTSSPRATLDSFMENCTSAYHLLKTNGRNSDNQASIADSHTLVRDITRCLDLSEVAGFRRDIAAKESAVMLKEVLGRIELPKEREIPDHPHLFFESITCPFGEK